MWFFITFMNLNTNTWVLIWTMVTQIIITILNYIFSKLLVFNKNKDKQSNNLFIKKLLIGIGIMLVTILLGWLLMIITYLIPNNRVQKNIDNSITCFEGQGNWPVLLDDYSSTTLDNYTDAIILNELYYKNENESAIKKSLRVYGNYNGNNPVQSLITNIKGENKEKKVAYERYWHGNLVIAKILMIFFDYRAIRILNVFAISILIFLICKWMEIREREKFIIPFILSVLLINPFVISLSFQFSAVFYIMLISILIILKYKNIFDKKNLYPYYFLIIGMATSFFDLLTYPLVTLGTLLIFYIMLDNKRQKNKKNWINIVKKIIFYSLIWGIGYGVMWSSKWVISSLIFHENLIKDALNQILVRTDIATNFTRFDAVEKNIKVFNRPAYYLLFTTIFIYYIIKFIRRKKLQIESIKAIIPYGIVSIMPICWYFILSNHSYIHYWFTYRSLIIFIMAGMFFMEEFFQEKQIEMEK